MPEYLDPKDFEKIQKQKAKIVSVLAQTLYIMCALSKEQIKNITKFWKAMMSFISPESEQVVKRIHVSYSGCVREAQKKAATIEAGILEKFRNCLYFSLALDTAQFGQDHFISCVSRFGFDDRISQKIIIFEKVSETTGQYLARFVFEKLDEKNCDFSKLISITTDGASNMIGREHGMANEMVMLVNQKLNTPKRIGVDIHCLWCIDHRLNLVAQDFKDVPNINYVIKFLKWITASDRLTSYTSFARMRFPNIKKKIPPPSETRWLFYTDTLKAVLDQPDMIEAFLIEGNNMEKWMTHVSSSKHLLGQIRDVPLSFKTPLVMAHFRFAAFILDVLGRINEIFQVKYAFVN